MSTTYGFDKETVQKLKRDHDRLLAMVLPLVSASGQRTPVGKAKRLRFRNDSADTIPAYGVMRVTGLTNYAGQAVITVDEPSTTFSNLYLLNGSMDVAADGDGYCQPMRQYFLAAYDAGTPVFGEGWGPKPSQSTLSKGYPGFVIVGIHNSTDKIAVVEQRPMLTLLGKANGAISARSGTTPGTGTMDIYYVTGTTLTDTTMDVTVKNLSATAVTASAYIMAKWIGDAWYVDFEDCT